MNGTNALPSTTRDVLTFMAQVRYQSDKMDILRQCVAMGYRPKTQQEVQIVMCSFHYQSDKMEVFQLLTPLLACVNAQVSSSQNYDSVIQDAEYQMVGSSPMMMPPAPALAPACTSPLQTIDQAMNVIDRTMHSIFG